VRGIQIGNPQDLFECEIEYYPVDRRSLQIHSNNSIKYTGISVEERVLSEGATLKMIRICNFYFMSTGENL
jgi:hypothetical protein